MLGSVSAGQADFLGKIKKNPLPAIPLLSDAGRSHLLHELTGAMPAAGPAVACSSP